MIGSRNPKPSVWSGGHSIASVTMAYNAGKTLPRQIRALLVQHRSIQEIIVVDNASTDGTAAMLAEQFPQITVLRMRENLGAAGAWAAGLSYAVLEKGHDWVWSFDDDSVPPANGLMCLLNNLRRLTDSEEAIGMVVPMPVHPVTGAMYPPTFWRNGFVKPSPEDIRKPLWFADMAIASGSLIRGDVVRDVGLPRCDFFMDVFDFEYCLRVRSAGYQIAVINDAKLPHEIGNTREVHFLGRRRVWMNQPPWREYYIGRNLAYLAWRLYRNNATKYWTARYLAVHFAGVLLFSSNRFQCALKVIQGLRDGMRGELGIRFRPGPATDAGGKRELSAAENAEAHQA